MVFLEDLKKLRLVIQILGFEEQTPLSPIEFENPRHQEFYHCYQDNTNENQGFRNPQFSRSRKLKIKGKEESSILLDGKKKNRCLLAESTRWITLVGYSQ